MLAFIKIQLKRFIKRGRAVEIAEQSFEINERSIEQGDIRSGDDNSLTIEETELVVKMVKEKREQEKNKPPTIAIVGITGAGKSSTLNSLFSLHLGVNHFKSCTQKGTPVLLENDKGKIIVYDMPGLGEDEEKDEEHKAEYRKILPECDVVLWIIDVSTREISSQQRYLREILSYLEGRIVVCCNKADKIQPDNWNTVGNFPSTEQQENLENRIKDIREKLCKVIPELSEEVIVYYSAEKRYNLNGLFTAMLTACPKNRGWVMNDRINLADYRELIDQKILKEYLDARRQG